MKNLVLGSAFILSTLSFGAIAHACDMHGGGFGGFGMGSASWKTYNPQASTFDPAYDYQDKELVSPLDKKSAGLEKAKPSFSNAANIAALRAKARMAKKTQDTAVNKKAIVKKAALDADG